MAVKIIPKENKTAALAEQQQKSAAALLDMAICEAVDALAIAKDAYDVSKKETAKLETRYKEAKDNFDSLVSQAPLAADEEKRYTGEKYEAKVGAQALKIVSINSEAAIPMLNKVKKGLAFELMKFNAGDLEKYLTPDQCAIVIIRERSGPRSIKIDTV
jgi:hypothetical protein